MKKLIKWIKDYMPISRKQHFETMKKITDVLQGLIQSELQHAQVEMNMGQQLALLTGQNPPNSKQTEKPEDKRDVSIQ